MKGFLQQKDLQKKLNVSRTTLWRWRKNNEGPPFIKVGGTILYPKDKYDQWVDEESDQGAS